jgi:DNA polymerase elongation subunit (family B)
MDGYMLRLGLERGVHFATKVFRDEAEDQFAGAYVMPPQANGIMKNVHVADFAALYPSIILTWNMSPETKGAKRKLRDHVPEGFSWSPLTHFTFATGIDGILPTALRELIRLRKTWNDTKASKPPGTDEWKDADRKSTAYKVIANSFYGCLGNRGSRYYDREIAESVTQCGKWLILKTIEAGNKKKLTTIYSDTDSNFVAGCTQPEFEEFVAQCNAELYPRILQEVGCATNEIKLAYEKEFERVVFCSAKKYAGKYRHFKGKMATKDSKPEIKGLEYKRGDAALLARTLQLRVINELMAGEENPEKFRAAVEDMLRHVMLDPLPLEEIRFSKSISKPLKEYAEKTKKDGTAQSSPEHVRVARELEKRGIPVREGMRVAYYVFDGSDGVQVAPIEDLSDEKPVDRYYMWEAKIFPPTQRLLQAAFPHYPWEDQYAKQRPQKRHEGQLGLFGGGPVRIAPVAKQEHVFIGTRGGQQLLDALKADRVVVDESRQWARILKETIARAPGDSPLEVVVRFDDGSEAILDVPAKVDANRFEDVFFEVGFDDSLA